MKTTDHPLYEHDLKVRREWHRNSIEKLKALLEKYEAEERELTRRIEEEKKDIP